MTHAVLLALGAMLCCGCAATNGGGERAAPGPAREQARLGGAVAPLAVSQAAAPASTSAVTLTWTMPTRKINGDTLWTAPLDWQVAYSTQSRTYVAHEFWIRNYPDTMTAYWPTVVDEAAPLVVASGTASPGAHVAWPVLPVQSADWPFSWWIRTRQRPAGAWSVWSNPVTRPDNQ